MHWTGTCSDLQDLRPSPRYPLQLVRKLGMPGNVTALAWHPRLNQIFVGTGKSGHEGWTDGFQDRVKV